MKRRLLPLIGALLILTACGAGDDASPTTVPDPTTLAAPTTVTTAATTTTHDSGFPASVDADNGTVTIDERPESIISLSSTATEILFAIGAGDQVVAVDDQSNYPADAPITDLAAFTPNIEAILGYEPDLVIVAYEPGDLVTSLETADVPVLYQNAAQTIDDVYDQIEALGAATGNVDAARQVSEEIESGLARVVSETPEVPEGTTYFHELDNTFYTITSSTLFGEIYSLFGLENIADPADADGSAAGYPQLSGEYVVSADPDLIFLADALYGESPETVAARPGWGDLSAVQAGNVIPLDADVASRWGPRVVDFAEAVSTAIEGFLGEG